MEARRLALQEELDAKRVAASRNRMGQFATPTGLAVDIQRYARAHLGKNMRVRFMDPAIGTGAFYSALLDVFPQTRIGAAVGYEIDPHYGGPAAKLWGRDWAGYPPGGLHASRSAGACKKIQPVDL